MEVLFTEPSLLERVNKDFHFFIARQRDMSEGQSPKRMAVRSAWETRQSLSSAQYLNSAPARHERRTKSEANGSAQYLNSAQCLGNAPALEQYAVLEFEWQMPKKNIRSAIFYIYY